MDYDVSYPCNYKYINYRWFINSNTLCMSVTIYVLYLFMSLTMYVLYLDMSLPIHVLTYACP